MDKQKQMFRLIELWEQSGQRQSDFCTSQGISLASFGYWRTKWLASGQSEAVSEVRAPLFIPVPKQDITMEAPSPTVPTYEIIYPNGVRLSLPTLDLSILVQLLTLDVQS